MRHCPHTTTGQTGRPDRSSTRCITFNDLFPDQPFDFSKSQNDTKSMQCYNEYKATQINGKQIDYTRNGIIATPKICFYFSSCRKSTDCIDSISNHAKRLTEKSRKSHKQKPQPTPDTRRKRKRDNVCDVKRNCTT